MDIKDAELFDGSILDFCIQLEHDLFTEADTEYMGDGGKEVITGGAAVCKRCGKAEGDLMEPCVPRKPIVWFTRANGERTQARLIRENKVTAVVKPHIWIKSKEVKIHKRKARMRYAGRWV